MLERSSIVKREKQRIYPSGRTKNRPQFCPQKRDRVTVCIAAICEKGQMIVGASDRMVTSGDVEFEIPGIAITPPDAMSPVLKTVPLDQWIVSMTAGDAGFQADAMQQVLTRFRDSRSSPTTRVPIRDVARFYVDVCNEAKRQRSTDLLLSRFGLDTDSFIEKQNRMSPEFIRLITNELLNITVGDPVIFTGIDNIGAQIYLADGNGLSSANTVAFAAIGNGGHHAESQFMLAGHTRFQSFADTVLLTYIAKRRSQIAPGVGEQTDMFLISPTTGFSWFPVVEFKPLETIYQNFEAGGARALAQAKTEMRDYIETLRKKQQPPPPPT